MRKILVVTIAAACVAGLSAVEESPQYNKPLSGDREILHALDRLAFGPRPGDVDAVKAMGLNKWIDLQLHPERIPENPALEAQTKPLEQTPALPVAALKGAKKTLRAEDVLTPQQANLLRAASAKQDFKVLSRLPEEKQVQILTAMPLIRQRVLPMVSPELRAKVEAAVREQSPRQNTAPSGVENPLSAEQMQTLRQGSDQEAMDLLSSLLPDEAAQALAAMPGVRARLQPMLDPDLRKKLQAKGGGKQAAQGLAQAKFIRAIESDRQLEEVLADFWYNHFNVDAAKGADKVLVNDYDLQVIRPHVLGKFRDLLEATATSPAMMFYLDNWQSTVANPRPNPNRPKQAARGLNENYARELMELHTLGVDGGYTQKDVTEVARCFTGWTVLSPRMNGTFVYNDRMHDKGEKIVLGVKIPAGGGKEDGEKVLDILARNPSTARFISRELAQRFVADDPPQALVDRMAKTFHDTDGDIRAVLTTMIAAPEFFSEGAYRAKLKTPFEMIVSAVRATGAKVDNAAALANRIGALGEPLYRKVEPTGYSNVGTEWMNSAALMGRMNIAMDLTGNRLKGITVDDSRFSAAPADAAHALLFADASQPTLDAIGTQPDPAVVAGMLLGSPDFQRK